MESTLSAKLKVASAREEILSGFMAMRPMSANVREQVQIFVRLMTINEEVGHIRIGHQPHTVKLFGLLDEVEKLEKRFAEIEAQEQAAG